LRGLRGVERQVGLTRGTRQRGQVRAAWWQEKQDEVVDWSRCRVAAQDRSRHAGFAAVHHKTGWVTRLNHKTKTEGSAGGDGIRAHRKASKRRTRVGIARLASSLSEVRSPGIRPMVLRREFLKCPSGPCILVLCNMVVSSFGCLHIYLEERGWQPSLET
jgi:hypothetical protein